MATAAVVSGCALAQAQPAAVWPDTFEGRLQVLALVQSLNAEILTGQSATRILERWCRDHHLAVAPRIDAKVFRDAHREATAEQRARLRVGEGEELRYRRVQLRCGDRVLSEAENWYVPGRLTAEMNRELETGTTPYGRVIDALAPYRRTVTARLLWSPLPEGWENEATKLPPETDGALPIPDSLLEHRAVVYAKDHLPLAEVHEVYQRQLLDFAPRRSP